MPAMEFGEDHIDESKPIFTMRDAAKWSDRVKPGDVIQIAWSMMKQRRFARVVWVDLNPDLQTTRRPGAYADGRPLIRITLRIEHGADESHPRYVTWRTKTTDLPERRID